MENLHSWLNKFHNNISISYFCWIFFIFIYFFFEEKQKKSFKKIFKIKLSNKILQNLCPFSHTLLSDYLPIYLFMKAIIIIIGYVYKIPYGEKPMLLNPFTHSSTQSADYWAVFTWEHGIEAICNTTRNIIQFGTGIIKKWEARVGG